MASEFRGLKAKMRNPVLFSFLYIYIYYPLKRRGWLVLLIGYC